MIPAEYYQGIYLNVVLLMALYNCNWLCKSDANRIITVKRGAWGGYILSISFILFVGLRPINPIFSDTVPYADMYYAREIGIVKDIGDRGDWLFDVIMQWCSQRMSVHCFFLIIEYLYVIPIIIACRRWVPYNLSLALLFCFTSFSFFSYGTNGIRNGMGASLVILAISYITGSKKDKLLACLLSIAAVSIHRSCALPVLMMVVSLFYRNTKVILTFWCLSIFISLIAGGALGSFFANLGFDERLGDYITSTSSLNQFSSTGFRFDFLLYSLMPIVLGYYTVIKKKLFDWNYLIILHTYILSNSFWVMLIRASFSNRFAYLSWFLYPIVLAYPLLKFNIWGKRQGKYCACILFGHIAFTYLMWLVK